MLDLRASHFGYRLPVEDQRVLGQIHHKRKPDRDCEAYLQHRCNYAVHGAILVALSQQRFDQARLLC